MSLISDELGQASTKKKEFLGIMEKLIPWSQWVGIVQPHYEKGNDCGFDADSRAFIDEKHGKAA